MQLLSPASPGTSLLCLFSNFTQRPRLYGGAKMEESWDGEWGGGILWRESLGGGRETGQNIFVGKGTLPWAVFRFFSNYFSQKF